MDDLFESIRQIIADETERAGRAAPDGVGGGDRIARAIATGASPRRSVPSVPDAAARTLEDRVVSTFLRAVEAALDDEGSPPPSTAGADPVSASQRSPCAAGSPALWVAPELATAIEDSEAAASVGSDAAGETGHRRARLVAAARRAWPCDGKTAPTRDARDPIVRATRSVLGRAAPSPARSSVAARARIDNGASSTAWDERRATWADAPPGPTLRELHLEERHTALGGSMEVGTGDGASGDAGDPVASAGLREAARSALNPAAGEPTRSFIAAPTRRDDGSAPDGRSAVRGDEPAGPTLCEPDLDQRHGTPDRGEAGGAFDPTVHPLDETATDEPPLPRPFRAPGVDEGVAREAHGSGEAAASVSSPYSRSAVEPRRRRSGPGAGPARPPAAAAEAGSSRWSDPLSTEAFRTTFETLCREADILPTDASGAGATTVVVRDAGTATRPPDGPAAGEARRVDAGRERDAQGTGRAFRGRDGADPLGRCDATTEEPDGTPPYARQGERARAVEDLVAEIVRPMLRDWLNAHLRTIVEREVCRAIERSRSPTR